MSLQGIIIGDN